MLIPGQTQSGGIPATKTRKILLLQVAALATLLLMVAARAEASYIDLTTSGATGTINGAIFTQGATLSGTGVFPAFVQITGNDPVHDAYNTGANNVLDNGSSPTFNYSITVSQLNTATNPGYYTFLLDINEVGNSVDQYLSLDQLRIFSGPVAANQNTTDVDGVSPFPLGTLRYDMGAGNGVLLNYGLEPGSGRADMVLEIPIWAGSSPTDQVYLYSSFGALGVVGTRNYGASDGFEEWALNTQLVPTPEPSTFALYGLGASMLLVGGWWQKRRKELKS